MTAIQPEQLAKSGSEHGHQSALFCWAALNLSKYPQLKWLFAIKNAEKAGKIAGSLAKAEGVKAGVFDVFLPYAAQGYHGLFIEMKKPGETPAKRGKPSAEQLQFKTDMQFQGYGACVCYSWQEAKFVIEQYLA